MIISHVFLITSAKHAYLCWAWEQPPNPMLNSLQGFTDLAHAKSLAQGLVNHDFSPASIKFIEKENFGLIQGHVEPVLADFSMRNRLLVCDTLKALMKPQVQHVHAHKQVFVDPGTVVKLESKLNNAATLDGTSKGSDSKESLPSHENSNINSADEQLLTTLRAMLQSRFKQEFFLEKDQCYDTWITIKKSKEASTVLSFQCVLHVTFLNRNENTVRAVHDPVQGLLQRRPEHDESVATQQTG